jgi:hypothetical protein
MLLLDRVFRVHDLNIFSEPNFCFHPYTMRAVVLAIAAPVPDNSRVRHDTYRPAVTPVIVFIKTMEWVRLHYLGTGSKVVVLEIGQ